MTRVDAWQNARWLATAWVEQYGDRNEKLAESLKQLGPSPSPDDVDKVFSASMPELGSTNRVVREFNCDECHETRGVVVRFNENNDSNPYSCDVCPGCLVKALELLDG